ncbi:alpha/beta fold hydrolase [Hydromonas duriensis]|uniref:TAP-like protein n=1 Tax=Hydromonas duriensis TaxID=1527608 RepID=A0A4R6YB77_9BURK|nr:alpha/beta hydrolase [Hydromonas duriensis]TDR32840.1 hypothetical protein DFR44_102139 [Hydromonas duriensis]
MELLGKAFERVPTRIMKKRLQSVIHEDSRSFLPRINAPTLILQGRHDYLVSKTAGSTLARMIKDSTSQMLDGGHGLLQESPEAAANFIIQFIENHHHQR